MTIKRGFSFQWNEGSSEQHTWFVLTHEKDNQFVIANISSIAGKKFYDNTCVLKPNIARYSKITVDSFVFYKGAIIKTKDELLKLIENPENRVNLQAPCWLVDHMASGLMKSMATMGKIKNHYRTVYSPGS